MPRVTVHSVPCRLVSGLCEVERLLVTSIDLGLEDLFITSDGVNSGNSRYLKRYEARLAYLLLRLAKKTKGSHNRAKARLKVARLHARIVDCRLNTAHKASHRLINDNQVIWRRIPEGEEHDQTSHAGEGHR